MKKIIANFKMNLLKDEINSYINEIASADFNNKSVVFCPSSIYLNDFVEKGFLTGSQDISIFEKGSYTGEISGAQLDSLGVMYTIIGHSERRMNFDDSELVPMKIKNAINNDLKPILCVGETLIERNNGTVNAVLEREIDEAFSLINNVDISNVIIAYEPIWSIGTNVILEVDLLNQIIKYIKDYVFSKYDVQIDVIYGGSVNLDNIEQLETADELDGYLVGGLSLDAVKFVELVNKIQ